jgi:hypothetical protein
MYNHILYVYLHTRHAYTLDGLVRSHTLSTYTLSGHIHPKFEDIHMEVITPRE